MSMTRLAGFLGVLIVLALSVGFAALNGGQRVIVRLGFVTVYRVPLTVVVFTSVIVGMLVMLVAGIRSDLRVRRILRERLAREDEEEKARIYVDRHQQDLFEQETSGGVVSIDALAPDTGPEPRLDPEEPRTAS